ncbi:sulfurtransferase TusA family protein [Sporosarcina sp. JAI121]|uniref:sulfurtransferase TusA family protein n=1 Tax=Sporosarcina sp. JAI121 TaxID=2723064 RepID=UPI0015CC13BC|nr:sulfurtransferase TusA family protein [Sporosarcina sp. JAI121]NYF23251.1 rhodanese-related sulfurtransferase/TusA-related sulfurtransferase [Sporosarcina sp. JAI121]
MIKTDFILDAKGMACPMPIVKTRKIMKGLEPGNVLEVQATDRGSTADIKAWAESSGHYYLGTTEDAEVLTHYLRKSSEEERVEKKHPHVVSNEQLQAFLDGTPDALVLDVREFAEYAFGHIPGAKSMPLGELEEAFGDLDKETEMYIICRTGNRSDTASRKLTEAGFSKVKNVVPGMSEWNGPMEKVVQ